MKSENGKAEHSGSVGLVAISSGQTGGGNVARNGQMQGIRRAQRHISHGFDQVEGSRYLPIRRGK